MIDLRQFIVQKENLLNNDECNFLIETFNSHQQKIYLEECNNAFTGLSQHSTFLAQTLEEDSEACDLVHKKVKTMVNHFHEHIDSFNMFSVGGKESLVYPHKYRLLKYETGAQIHPHVDHSRGVYGSCTINLNDNYSGGEFGFWGNKEKVKLKKGEGLIFPADFYWVHQVNPIEKGQRYSTNCFLQDYEEEYSKKYNYLS